MQNPSLRYCVKLCGFWLGSLAVTATLGYSQSKTREENQPAPKGTIQVQVEYVPLNVIALDRQGQPVIDLKKEDIEVFEDDIVQEIRHFSQETLVPETAIPPKSGLRAVPTLHLAPQERRTFLILLGRGKLDRPFHNIDALIRFVQKGLLPQDQVALMAYNRATDFTTDHARIVAGLTSYKEEHEKIETRLDLHYSGLAAIFAPKKIPEDIQTPINSIFPILGAADSRQLGATAIAAGSETAAQANRDSLALLEKEMRGMGGIPAEGDVHLLSVGRTDD